ncbi:MAG TPA: YccF domain-containing protein [Reyranella sp.]|nr:YccF domain-containing protein [Reyranella sp.]
MRTLGNILWHFPFLGFVTAIFYFLLGGLLTITVIAAPIGLGLMEFGKFLFVPFGHAMVSKDALQIEQNPVWKTYSTIVMIIYLPFGILFAIINALQVVALCLTIIGIPVALVIAKSLGTILNPVNKKCVPAAVADELERRKAQQQIDKHVRA